MTRRELLLLAAQGALAKDTPDSPGQLIHSFEEQGSHRTGTETDNVSGNWLMDRVRRIGLSPSREPFTLNRVDLIAATLTIGDRRI